MDTSSNETGLIIPPQITYIGHATILVEMDGSRILTDPFLRKRLAHLRRHTADVDPDWHRDIDAVLISHLHLDHFDIPSLAMLGQSARIIVPRGAAGILQSRGWTNVEELQVGHDTEVGAVRVEAVFADHDGFRPPFGPVAEAVGYLIEGSTTVYFAGDTDLYDDMRDLAGRIDTALLPVWGWGPTLGGGHMDPHRAAEALPLLQPRLAVPIHWGTLYPLGIRWWRTNLLTRPPEEFAQFAQELAPEVNVRIISPGWTAVLNEEAAEVPDRAGEMVDES